MKLRTLFVFLVACLLVGLMANIAAAKYTIKVATYYPEKPSHTQVAVVP